MPKSRLYVNMWCDDEGAHYAAVVDGVEYGGKLTPGEVDLKSGDIFKILVESLYQQVQQKKAGGRHTEKTLV